MHVNINQLLIFISYYTFMYIRELVNFLMSRFTFADVMDQQKAHRPDVWWFKSVSLGHVSSFLLAVFREFFLIPWLALYHDYM